MQERRELADVRALLHQARGQADGQILWQVQGVELNRAAVIARGKRPHVGGEQVPLLRELRAQRRQCRERRLERGLLLQDIDAGGTARRHAPLRDVELCALRAGDLLGHRDLRAERCFGDRGGHHVGGQREIAGFERAALVIRLRLQRFDLAANTAEHIERVGYVHARAVQGIEIVAAAGQAERGERCVRTLPLISARQARIKRAPLGGEILVRLPERRLRGLERRVVLQRLLERAFISGD